MTFERYCQVNNEGKGLTKEEDAEGWHFCIEWDQLLIGPGMIEMDTCSCFGPQRCTTCEDN